MQIQITGKHMDLGEALRTRIESGLEAAVSKYFNRAGDARVFVSQEGPFTEVDCNVHLPSGIILQSTGKAEDPYAALENSLDKMEKRVRRYKRRLKDHHANSAVPLPVMPAAEAILRVNGHEVDDEAVETEQEATAPLTVAETSIDIRTMSVSEAVMQLELQELPALMFRNAGHDGLNMVYRRPDGHIGWVDPENVSKS